MLDLNVRVGWTLRECECAGEPLRRGAPGTLSPTHRLIVFPGEAVHCVKGSRSGDVVVP